MELKSIPSLSPLKPLPVTVQLNKDESGMGYLYRLLNSNGLNFGMYRQLVAEHQPEAVDSRHASLIGYLGGADPVLLESRLPQKRSLARQMFISLAGHRLSNASHLRHLHPQICTSCIDESGITRLEWDFSACTCCFIHRVYLIDMCGYCRKPLGWNRPAINICSCGYYLSGKSLLGNLPTEQELDFADHLEQLIYDDQHGGDQSIPVWLAALSLDGLTFFLRSFGMCTMANQAFPSSRSWTKQRTAYWIELTTRALPRLIRLDDDPDTVKSLIHLPLLERFATQYADQGDRQIAEHWIKLLGGRVPKRAQANQPIQGRLFN